MSNFEPRGLIRSIPRGGRNTKKGKEEGEEAPHELSLPEHAPNSSTVELEVERSRVRGHS